MHTRHPSRFFTDAALLVRAVFLPEICVAPGVPLAAGAAACVHARAGGRGRPGALQAGPGDAPADEPPLRGEALQPSWLLQIPIHVLLLSWGIVARKTI